MENLSAMLNKFPFSDYLKTPVADGCQYVEFPDVRSDRLRFYPGGHHFLP